MRKLEEDLLDAKNELESARSRDSSSYELWKDADAENVKLKAEIESLTKQRDALLVELGERGAENERLKEESADYRGKLIEGNWECPGCAFMFDRQHVTQLSGGYDCPICELEETRAELSDTTKQRDQMLSKMGHHALTPTGLNLLEQVRAELAKYQWAASESVDDEGGRCPACFEKERAGHDEACGIASALAKSKGET